MFHELIYSDWNFQYNHYFKTTYGSGYNVVDTSRVPEALKHLEGKKLFFQQIEPSRSRDN